MQVSKPIKWRTSFSTFSVASVFAKIRKFQSRVMRPFAIVFKHVHMFANVLFCTKTCNTRSVHTYIHTYIHTSIHIRHMSV